MASRSLEYYYKHRDRINKKRLETGYSKQYYQNHKNEAQKYHIDNYESKIIAYMWRRAKTRALNSKLEFNIDRSDIIIPTICPILEIELKVQTGNGHRSDPQSPSLDRIDNSKGYIKGNVQVISRLANMMKSSATKEQILMFVKNVEKYITQSN